MFCSVINDPVECEILLIFNEGTVLRLARTSDLIFEFAVKFQKSIEDLHNWKSFDINQVDSEIDAIDIAKHASFTCHRKTVASFINFVTIERGSQYDEVIETIRSLDSLCKEHGMKVIQTVFSYLALMAEGREKQCINGLGFVAMN